MLSDPTFGPLTGVAAQFNFDEMFGIIGNELPPGIVFTGGTVTGEFTASVAGYTEDTAFTVATSVLTGNDSDPEGNPITFVSVQDAGRRHRQPVRRQYHLRAGGQLYRRGELHLHDPGFIGAHRHRDGLVQHLQCQRRAGDRGDLLRRMWRRAAASSSPRPISAKPI